MRYQVLFSSVTFLYYFLPVVLAAYFIAPRRAKNYVLLLSSLVFYFNGEPVYTLLLLFSSLVDYTNSRIIEKNRPLGVPNKKAKAALGASLIINLGLLAFFKYSDFFIQNMNAIFGANIPLLKLALPIGISFYTFQTLSYTIDVYRGDVPAQKNIATLATYVTLFVQLVAGPIVRYKTVADQLESRNHTLHNFACGVRRFTTGLAKKVLIANALGELVALLAKTQGRSALSYWLGAIAFMLQIYFDFSGYSDMAIGLGRALGFTFLENFNYPFISKSVAEFWRRWHISLGSWFRDYVYVPLGGNRVSKLKWIRNIFIVWFLTGFWHGASWNFIIWGVYFGALLIGEKMLWGNVLKKSNVVAHIYTLLLLTISFVIFNSLSLGECFTTLGGMFGAAPAVDLEALYYLRSYAVTLLIAILGATPLIKTAAEGILKRCRKVATVLEPVWCAGLLVTCTGYLIDSSFNPFLYFRF